MPTPLTVEIPHQLGRAEARRRIEEGFLKLVEVLPGAGANGNQRWEGDRLVFSVGTLGQTISGVIDVGDAVVTMQIQLPGVLGVIAAGLKRRLQSSARLLLTRK